MRYNIKKQNSTRAERIVYEILKELGIPFKHRWIIQGRKEKEIDFLIGNIAIEVDGHEQNVEKNNELVQLGYVPIHFRNREVYNNREKVKEIIKNAYKI